MARSTSRSSALLFGFLALYILLQSAWWMWLLLSKDRDVMALQKELLANGVVPQLPVKLPAHSLMMVLGEGVVFLVLIVLALWIIYRSLRQELHLARQQRDFLMATSHELRTPIAALKLHLQTLQRTGLDEARREELAMNARKDVERLHELTEKILLASRLEESIVPLESAETDLANEAASIIAAARQGFARDHVIDAEMPTSLITPTDAGAFRSVLTNLLENACKYSPSGSSVRVELLCSDGSALLRVSDSGPGIPVPDRGRIFEKFYRGGYEETRDTKGTGLGLFIVERLMSALGGRVEFRPALPTGAIFTATFPCRP